MKAPFIAAWFAIVAALQAQDLAPELAPVAAKYKADIAALEALKAATFARMQQPYIAALDAAEKTATSAGSLEAVAGITKERAALKSGLMAPAFPGDLPKTLQPARKNYVDSIVRIPADEAQRRRAIDADYLRALGSLQTKAISNPELAKQIAAEKDKLLANVASGTAAAAGAPKASGRNAVVNGNFDAADAAGTPSGWKVPSEDGVTFKVGSDGTNHVLRVTVTGALRNIKLSQEVEVPPRAKTFTVRVRIRGKATGHDPSDDNWGANVGARFTGADGTLTGPWTILVGGKDAGWKTLTKGGPVVAGAKTMKVEVGAQFVAGTFDFDDVEVEFR